METIETSKVPETLPLLIHTDCHLSIKSTSDCDYDLMIAEAMAELKNENIQLAERLDAADADLAMREWELRREISSCVEEVQIEALSRDLSDVEQARCEIYSSQSCRNLW